MWSRRIALLSVPVVLTACAAWQKPPVELAPPPAVVVAPEPVAEADIAGVLLEHERLVALPAIDQLHELARLGTLVQLWPEGDAPVASVQMALLLAHKGGPVELARASAVLDRIAASDLPAALPWQPLARLLSVQWSEQRRLLDRVDKQSVQLRDGQRRIEQLGETVAALKAIELSLPAKPAKAPAAEAAAPANGGGNP